MRFFSMPYRDSMSYRDTTRIPPRGESGPKIDSGYASERQSSRENGMSEDALLLYIQRLDFVRVELELYLDAYPESQSALRYYRETIAKLRGAREEYESKYAPLTASFARGDSWLWTRGKWPWQKEEWR